VHSPNGHHSIEEQPTLFCPLGQVGVFGRIKAGNIALHLGENVPAKKRGNLVIREKNWIESDWWNGLT